MSRPILGISMGDPFGNGPEITVRALADATIYDRCKPLVVGDESSMRYAPPTWMSPSPSVWVPAPWAARLPSSM